MESIEICKSKVYSWSFVFNFSIWFSYTTKILEEAIWEVAAQAEAITLGSPVTYLVGQQSKVQAPVVVQEEVEVTQAKVLLSVARTSTSSTSFLL